MRVLVAVAQSMDAPTLIDVHSAHVDGCLYVGAVSIDFVKALVDGSARVSVPTTLNVGSDGPAAPAVLEWPSRTWRPRPEP